MSDFLRPSTVIDGVVLAHLRAFADERGRFSETFRASWFPQADWSKIQCNRSDSAAGVLRGLHYHFRQVDYWTVPVGQVRAALVDLRPQSPSYRQAQTIDIAAEDSLGLFIPVGVAHGFYALTDCTLLYTVNNYYDGQDEFGVAWDDPDLGLDWRLPTPPRLSARDQANPRLMDILPQVLPR